MTMKKKMNDSIIIGLALFAMFFGAGNLIFPPQIGMEAGNIWKAAAAGFFFTGIGLPLLGIFAAVKGGEALKKFQPKVGKGLILIFTVVVALTLGFVAIPRTGATTYEMGFTMFYKDFSPIVASIIFFGMTIVLAIKPTGIVDRIGKYLTPVLVIMLGTIIVKGIVDPIGISEITYSGNAFSMGFLGGYQTMDALGALIFGGIVLNSFREKGYTREKEQMSMAIISGGIASLGLALVYGGLMYLGSTATGLVSSGVSKTSLTIIIATMLLGKMGTWMLGIGVSFACLTTSVGLVATIAGFFANITSGKIRYEFSVIVLCFSSAFLAVLGVEGIMRVAGPILVVVYPIAILLILFILIDPLVDRPIAYKITIATTFTFSLLQGISEAGVMSGVVNRALASIPMNSGGFPWLLPAIIAFSLTYLMTLFPLYNRRQAHARR